MLRRLIVIATAVGALSLIAATNAPDTSSQCTPLAAPVVCLNINGSGLHVNYFEVQVMFSRKVPAGSTVKGWDRVRHGPNGPIILEKFTTWTVQSGAWAIWRFTVNKNYPDGYVACANFVDTVPGGVFQTYKPCGTIHS
jgi:opacity protein-like surface antigen